MLVWMTLKLHDTTDNHTPYLGGVEALLLGVTCNLHVSQVNKQNTGRPDITLKEKQTRKEQPSIFNEDAPTALYSYSFQCSNKQ